ncbi:hypothetical protein ABZO31_32995 [Streptomyces sp. HUAS MG47]|uniref:hypothetical protein n=1 Tax=Streptomyces solicamelliae TaxID=3231716 RepID=UPI003877F6FB
MANWAMYLVIPEDGGAYEAYAPRFGAVGIDLDLLAGPDVVLSRLRAREQWARDWIDEGRCEAAALIDLPRRTLFLFAWEGPITELRHRAATWEALGAAWPGWELRWTYDGPADLREYLGLDPEGVREPELGLGVFPEYAMEPGDEELAEPDPMVRVVTIGADRCHVLSSCNDHPIVEGPALLGRLADAPDHRVCTAAADSGIHVDPERRRVGWWLLGASAGARRAAEHWPGWTVEFWADRWEEHVRAAGGRFAPPAVDRRQARAEVRAEALERWSPDGPRELQDWMQAAALAPDIATGVARLFEDGPAATGATGPVVA